MDTGGLAILADADDECISLDESRAPGDKEECEEPFGEEPETGGPTEKEDIMADEDMGIEDGAIILKNSLNLRKPFRFGSPSLSTN